MKIELEITLSIFFSCGTIKLILKLATISSCSFMINYVFQHLKGYELQAVCRTWIWSNRRDNDSCLLGVISIGNCCSTGTAEFFDVAAERWPQRWLAELCCRHFENSCKKRFIYGSCWIFSRKCSSEILISATLNENWAIECNTR